MQINAKFAVEKRMFSTQSLLFYIQVRIFENWNMIAPRGRRLIDVFAVFEESVLQANDAIGAHSARRGA